MKLYRRQKAAIKAAFLCSYFNALALLMSFCVCYLVLNYSALNDYTLDAYALMLVPRVETEFVWPPAL